MSSSTATAAQSAQMQAVLQHDALSRTVQIDKRLDAKIEQLQEQRDFRTNMNRLLVFAVVLGIAYVYVRVSSLGSEYEDAYLWWAKSGKLETNDAMMAASHVDVTVPVCALRVEFPQLYRLQAAIMMVPSLPAEGAAFLLDMASQFGGDLKRAHWYGNATTLRFEDLVLFLPRQKPGDWGYIWEAWSAVDKSGAPVNPWMGVIFQDAKALANSPAIQAYYASPPDTAFVDALFRGGLVEIALTLSSPARTGEQMVEYLTGFQAGYTLTACSSKRRAIAAATGAMGTASMAAMVGGGAGHAIAAAASRMSPRARAIVGLLPMFVTGVAVGGGAYRGDRQCKHRKTSYSGLGAGKVD